MYVCMYVYIYIYTYWSRDIIDIRELAYFEHKIHEHF